MPEFKFTTVFDTNLGRIATILDGDTLTEEGWPLNHSSSIGDIVLAVIKRMSGNDHLTKGDISISPVIETDSGAGDITLEQYDVWRGDNPLNNPTHLYSLDFTRDKVHHINANGLTVKPYCFIGESLDIGLELWTFQDLIRDENVYWGQGRPNQETLDLVIEEFNEELERYQNLEETEPVVLTQEEQDHRSWLDQCERY